MRHAESEYGTKVRRPVHRSGEPGYSRCTGCSKLYTRLGISRHWDSCPSLTSRQRRVLRAEGV